MSGSRHHLSFFNVQNSTISDDLGVLEVKGYVTIDCLGKLQIWIRGGGKVILFAVLDLLMVESVLILVLFQLRLVLLFVRL